MRASTTVTAGLLVIGDEILSGRTRDVNIGTTAQFCTDLGIELREVRVVSDDTDAIVEAVNALRHRYTYVFTTGGIGPTHDDITADAVAEALIPGGLVCCYVATTPQLSRVVEALREDPRFYEPLVRAYEGRALRMAVGMMGHPDDARDAVQEAFVKVYNSLGGFDLTRPFGPWSRNT